MNKAFLLFICLLTSISLYSVELKPPKTPDQAIQRGLSWLRSQQLDNGRIQDGDNQTAMTAMAINAHLANGITYQDPKHGPWLLKSLRFILQMQDSTGYFGSRDKSRMYGHGMCTLVLAESYGMTGDPNLDNRIRAAINSAVSVTESAAQVKKKKEFSGGWHYTPNGDHSDLSLSGWQVLSLHAVDQAGIPISEKVMKQAVSYTVSLCDPKAGSVGYNSANAPRDTLKGVGLLCLSMDKQHVSSELSKKIADAITKQPIEWKGPWFFYRIYYEAAGLGRAYPDQLTKYQKHIDKILLAHQDKEGWWHTPPGDNEARYGKVYRTSLAVMALSLHQHLLPAYQP